MGYQRLLDVVEVVVALCLQRVEQSLDEPHISVQVLPVNRVQPKVVLELAEDLYSYLEKALFQEIVD